jgi:hypothetical protein
MARFKVVDNVRIQLTDAEEAELDAQAVAYEAGAFDRDIADLREKRTRLLTQTDWHGLSDVTMSAAMTQYRQDLRDLPSGLTTVEEVKAVVWPTPPAS